MSSPWAVPLFPAVVVPPGWSVYSQPATTQPDCSEWSTSLSHSKPEPEPDLYSTTMGPSQPAHYAGPPRRYPYPAQASYQESDRYTPRGPESHLSPVAPVHVDPVDAMRSSFVMSPPPTTAQSSVLSTLPPLPFQAQTRHGSPFMVYHVCSECRQPRSARYHREHPVHEGQALPPSNICRRCIEGERKPRFFEGVDLGTKSVGQDATRHTTKHHTGKEQPTASVAAPLSSHNISSRHSHAHETLESAQFTHAYFPVPPHPPPPSASTVFEPPASSTKAPSVARSQVYVVRDEIKHFVPPPTPSSVAPVPSVTHSEIRRVAREEIDRLREERPPPPDLPPKPPAYVSPSEVRNIAHDEIKRYREAERQLDSHPHAFSHGTLKPVCRAQPEQPVFHQSAPPSQPPSMDQKEQYCAKPPSSTATRPVRMPPQSTRGPEYLVIEKETWTEWPDSARRHVYRDEEVYSEEPVQPHRDIPKFPAFPMETMPPAMQPLGRQDRASSPPPSAASGYFDDQFSGASGANLTQAFRDTSPDREYYTDEWLVSNQDYPHRPRPRERERYRQPGSPTDGPTSISRDEPRSRPRPRSEALPARSRQRPVADSKVGDLKPRVTFASRDDVATLPPRVPSELGNNMTGGMSRLLRRGRDLDGSSTFLPEDFEESRGRRMEHFDEAEQPYVPEANRALARALSESPSRERHLSLQEEFDLAPSYAHGPYRAEISPSVSMEVLVDNEAGSRETLPNYTEADVYPPKLPKAPVGAHMKGGRPTSNAIGKAEGKPTKSDDEPGWTRYVKYKEFRDAKGPWVEVEETIVYDDEVK